MSSPETTIQATLEDELLKRLWALYDAAKFFMSYDARRTSNEPTPEQWEALYRAVAAVPESRHP